MDRICLIRMDYQSEAEEREIVRIRTGIDDPETVSVAVHLTRATREHADIKLGASVRAAIDMVDLFVGMQNLSDQPEQNMLIAARMALSNKIWLNEMSRKTADEIIEEIWSQIRGRYKTFADNSAGVPRAPVNRQDSDQTLGEGQGAKKKSECSLAYQFLQSPAGGLSFDFDSNDPRHYWQMAHYYNDHPEELGLFFEQPGCLQALARMLDRLQDDVAVQAVRIASRLIIAIAKQIADTGYRPSKLKLIPGLLDGAEIALDHSLEKYAEAPERGILDNLASYVRQVEKKAFVMMLDYSYSMQNKIILAAITAAAIAQHFRTNYAVLAFNSGVCVLKAVKEAAGPETVLARLFALQSYGDTNIRLVLEAGLNQVSKFERKAGLLLTDGDWNKGGDPFAAAVQFDKLSVIGFPSADHRKIRRLAMQGKGNFSMLQDETEIAAAIIRCLN